MSPLKSINTIYFIWKDTPVCNLMSSYEISKCFLPTWLEEFWTDSFYLVYVITFSVQKPCTAINPDQTARSLYCKLTCRKSKTKIMSRIGLNSETEINCLFAAMLVNSIAMAWIALFNENSFFETVSYLLLSFKCA